MTLVTWFTGVFFPPFSFPLSIQTVQFVRNMTKDEKVLIFTERKATYVKWCGEFDSVIM